MIPIVGDRAEGILFGGIQPRLRLRTKSLQIGQLHPVWLANRPGSG